jgi:hypothetical protein
VEETSTPSVSGSLRSLSTSVVTIDAPTLSATAEAIAPGRRRDPA